ncbi:molybdate ABC transporter substrate-binding protein [Mucilaginibacter psychrotolerans]|uniref:Molybdate ABC transporter substrate-binding protein n=2 Tax=Mucilaginibacter psychrotolerans TaxID=1524096 RepID=A0A4Y8S5Q9_9SPHI|nr:molybdate ABC transporter substrate-binding protein [Mucilaginibacter psychrotolerans]
MAMLVIAPASLFAQQVRIAIAANLQPVIKALQQDFKQRTGIETEAIPGPSGALATQIKNGAPYDVFLSADTTFPNQLFKSGFATAKPVIYAQGALIICSTQNLDVAHWQTLLKSVSVQKIAIGNPAIAPYGKAAEEALKHEHVYANVQAKLVLGESIAQVNTYITTGVVQAGFTTLSLVKDTINKTPFYYQLINPRFYKPIEQGMVLIKQATPNTNAGKFYRYILSPAAKKIFISYGYQVK